MKLHFATKKAVEKQIFDEASRIEKALIYTLEYMVRDLINHAKLNKGYKDQTANLKSSIGGCVLKNGKPVTYRGYTGKKVGSQTGLEYLNSIIPEVKMEQGYVIVVTAGMEYATYVENYHGLNVLKKSELYMNQELPKLMAELKTKVAKKFGKK
jgi:hypothetical protein